MKLCVAQTRPATGDVPANIERHKAVIATAASNGADVIVFPELSLTGYEPTIAKELAIDQNDSRLDQFQFISDSKNLTIGVGVPTTEGSGVCISMILFQPHTARRTYSKQYLHRDEEPFFVSGRNITCVTVGGTRIAPAICYELSVQEHSEAAFRSGAAIYMASVAKTATGLATALPTLADIARRYSMTVVMANCVGDCDGGKCGGKTSIWNQKGILLAQLNGTDEGMLILDPDRQEVTEKTL